MSLRVIAATASLVLIVVTVLVIFGGRSEQKPHIYESQTTAERSIHILHKLDEISSELSNIENGLFAIIQTQLSKTAPDAAQKQEIYLEENYAVVPVFFATDRNITVDREPSGMFGTNRSEISYGTCEVSIPRNHKIGDLESPSILRFEFTEDPEKHVVLLNATVQDRDTYFSNLAARVQSSQEASAFLFVHGYNVTFEDAARRTAQISYDLQFDGAPVFYSWPSQGNIPGYTVDEQNIEWSQNNIRGFLEDFLERSDAQNVYLIAHSMGNRALTRSIASLLNEKPDLRGRLTEIILTAPDIDADVFKRDIAPKLTQLGRPITLYASSEDTALAISKFVHGNPRAGEAGDQIIVYPGIETVDATGRDTSFLGHSYFAGTRSVLSDINALVQHGQRPDARFELKGVNNRDGKYWVFRE